MERVIEYPYPGMPNLETRVFVVRGVGQIKILPITHNARAGMVNYTHFV